MEYSWRMDATTRQAIHAIAEASRSLSQRLEDLLADQGSAAPTLPPSPMGDSGPARSAETVWDPEADAPLLSPKVHGTREERAWCSLTYLGGIYAINKRQARGADKHEIREYARKAGYRDGRAVTAWSKGNGGTQNDDDKQRWVTANSVNWVKDLAGELGVVFPADLAEHWDAPDFG